MSSQECQIARCSPNQLEMTTNSPALASEQCPIPHHIGHLAWLPLANSGDSLRLPSQVNRNTNFSTGSRGRAMHPYHRKMRADSQDSAKTYATFPQAPPEEPSLSNRYVRGTLNLLPHVQWILKFPTSKESRNSLKWLECRLVFHLTR